MLVASLSPHQTLISSGRHTSRVPAILSIHGAFPGVQRTGRVGPGAGGLALDYGSLMSSSKGGVPVAPYSEACDFPSRQRMIMI